jgi:PEP-CTERM motif
MKPISMATAVLVFVGFTAGATTINFASGDGVGESNNVTGINVLINVAAAWQPNGVGKWISYADTGSPGTVSTPDTSITVPTALFYEDFQLGDGLHTATFSVWADDTASVSINGFALSPLPNPVQGGACVDGPIGCTPENGFTFNITDADGLKTGENTLTISAYQRANGPFGVLYEGTATSTTVVNIETNPTPEPASTGLLGGGVTAIGLWRRKRKLMS